MRNIKNTLHNSQDCFQPPDHLNVSGGFCLAKNNRSLKMKKTFLIAAAVAVLPCMAHAGLQVNLNSAAGTQCYSESNVLRLIMCGPLSFYGDNIPYDKCPDTYAELLSGDGAALCYIGTKNGYLYVCEVAERSDDVCRYCSLPFYTPWEAIGANRVRRQVMSDYNENTGSNWRCDMTAEETYYGCVAGYYTNATVPSATMTCNACPTSGGVAGHSYTGNVAITGCFIPSGSGVSDNTGSGVLTDDCYYTK